MSCPEQVHIFYENATARLRRVITLDQLLTKSTEGLDDLCVRFIINIPQEELQSVERICFQVEEAQWFYEDFIRPLDPSLPHLTLRQFCLLIFQHCPLFAGFSAENHIAAFSEFLTYKTRVPVRGAIMLNDEMDEVVLVKGWKKSANWSFPRGKINKDEKDLDCAVREAYEETGFDIAAAGLVFEESKMKSIEITMRDQHMKLYVFRGVPRNTIFQPRTRKEISKIEWYKLSKLPGWHKKRQGAAESEDTVNANKLYMVAPFLAPLKRWITYQRKCDSRRSQGPYENEIHSEGIDTDEQLPRDENTLPWQHLSTPDVLLSSNMSRNPQRFYDNQLDDSQTDTAIQLKQLLSMPTSTPRAEPAAASTNQQRNNLLSLLQQPADHRDHFSRPLEEPFLAAEHVLPHPGTLSNPRQHHPVPPFPSSIQPPPMQPPLPSDNLIHSSASSSNINPKQSFSNSTEHKNSSPLQSVASQQANLQLQPSASDKFHAATQLPLHPPRNLGQYQNNSPEPSSGLQPPVVPDASALPLPKLSSHAQSLLDVFKGDKVVPKPAPLRTSGSSAPSPLQSAELHHTNSELGSHEWRGSSSHRVAHPPAFKHNSGGLFKEQPILSESSRGRQLQHRTDSFSLTSPSDPSPWYFETTRSRTRDNPDKPMNAAADFNASSQETISPGLTATYTSLSTTPAVSTNVPYSKQDRLLSLFNTSLSPSKPLAHNEQQEMASTAGPVELSAVPSPGLTPPYNEKRQVSSMHHIAAERRSPLVPSTATDFGGTRATVKAPHKLPEFEQYRRKPNAGPELSKTLDTSSQVSQPPVHILKRPSITDRGSSLLDSWQGEQAQSSSPGSASISTGTLFRPKILKRTQPESQVAPGDATQTDDQSSGRQQSTTDEQKQALLSLFSRSKLPEGARSPVTSGVISPTSAASEKERSKEVQTPVSAIMNPQIGIGTNSTGFGEQSRPRMGSYFGMEQKEATRLADSRKGSSTPISPNDRGFLLNYLEDVVSKAR